MLNEDASVPDRRKLKLSPSASVAVTVPTSILFSSTIKVEDEVMLGEEFEYPKSSGDIP